MDLELVRRILDTKEAVMPQQRYQDPKVLTRKDVPRPYFYILVAVPFITESGEITRKRKPFHLGYCDETTMREAKEAKRLVLGEANNGRGLLQAQVPFGKVLDRYIEVRLPQIPACTSYENLIKNHLRPAFGKLRMCDIDRALAEDFFNQKEAAGYSHNTLLDIRKVLSAVFEKSREWKLWDGSNPCSKLKVGGVRQVFSKKLPKEAGIGQFIDAIEPTRIIDAAGARLIVLVAVSAGLREAEVLGLKPGDVDAEAETIAVQRDVARGRVGPTKTPESERVRQLPELAGVLLEYAAGKEPNEFIFTHGVTGEPLDDRDLQNHVFRPALERAGIYVPGLGIRRFRHVNITWRQQAGATPFEAMRAAGQTQPSTTWIYTHNEDERDRKHVKAILDRLNGTDKRLFLVKRETA